MEDIKMLLVEDEPVLAQIIRETLITRGFDILLASNGVEGWSVYQQSKPDICVVDIMMPRKDGISLVEDIRKIDEDTPIIFLTAKTQTADVIRGLEVGADDYMKKPFSMEELILRAKSLTRRRSRQPPEFYAGGEPVTFGEFQFDPLRMQLSRGEDNIQLSQRESDLLNLLLASKNQLLDRKTALLKLWGEDDFFNTRSMDVYITRLRKYLRPDSDIQIVNVRGKGYQLKVTTV